jgi:hypothetical protein
LTEVGAVRLTERYDITIVPRALGCDHKYGYAAVAT